MPSLKSQIESLLFVSGEPLKLAKIAKICDVSKNEILTEIEALNGEYRENRGFMIIQKEDSVQLTTNPQNSTFVSQLVAGEMDAELSKAALEVLSIVAYRGPVTRIQIEAIRGVNCSYVLRSLLIRGLVERKDVADIRGYLYEISFDFLKTLGVSSTKDLPDWEKLSKDEKIEEILSSHDQKPINSEQ